MNHIFLILLAFSLLLLLHCGTKTEEGELSAQNEQEFEQLAAGLPADSTADSKKLATAVFASGCFWCTEAIFERVKGVQEVISGYAGGKQQKPTYKEVSAGQTDHAEAVIVYYDSTQLNYQTLLEIFFHSHDPTQLNRQGPDVGKQYRSAIFYQHAYQRELAEHYVKQLSATKEFKQPIVTEITPLPKFWPAEKYHQDYYKHHPDDPYIRSVSMPKVKKFEKEYRKYLKEGV